MRAAFDEQLRQLRQELIGMSGECEEALARATGAFMTGDGVLAASVIKTAESIDRRERDIEAMCLKLLLTQHPVATDLRTVSSALKMVTDLERIGNRRISQTSCASRHFPTAPSVRRYTTWRRRSSEWLAAASMPLHPATASARRR